jgi:uncharacterized protein YciI
MAPLHDRNARPGRRGTPAEPSRHGFPPPPAWLIPASAQPSGRALTLFVVTAFDRPGAGELRARHRPAHLEYLKGRAAQMRAGGALLDAGEQPIGSMLIIEAAAEALVAGDPFREEGVFERVEVRPWRAVLGTWVG